MLSFISLPIYAQNTEEDKDDAPPIILKLDEDGEQFVRVLMWHQIWLTSHNLSESGQRLQLNPSIRRSRILAFAQISPDFLILTHFGVNSLNADQMSSFGSNGDGAKLFLHDVWGEFRIDDKLYIGGGLHYWKGLTRLASQSTINFMTLDQSRPFTSWHSLGITDQYARHLGIYGKGQVGRFDYRLALNTPIRSPLAGGMDYGLKDSGLTYDGVNHTHVDGYDVGNTITEGYVRYNLWDLESTKLPYNVGTYLGSKKVFAIGAGFFFHPNGMYRASSQQHFNVRHFAVDAFLDFPLPEGALNAYVSVTNFNYGDDYVGRWAGTGKVYYGQLGYYLKNFKLMPYLAVNSSHFDGLTRSITAVDAGVNYFLREHHAKLTLEYHRIDGDIREASIMTPNDAQSQIRLQMQIFL